MRVPCWTKSPRETLFRNFNVGISIEKCPINARKHEQYPHISFSNDSNSYFAFVVSSPSPQTNLDFKVQFTISFFTWKRDIPTGLAGTVATLWPSLWISSRFRRWLTA